MTNLINEFLTDRLTIIRYGKGVWYEGRYIKGDKEVFNIDACIQPLTPNEIRLLPEHRRNSETIKIYTNKRLFNSDEKNQIAGDIIEHDNKKYEIHEVSNWSIGTDLPHYKSIGVLIDGEGSGGHD